MHKNYKKTLGGSFLLSILFQCAYNIVYKFWSIEECLKQLTILTNIRTVNISVQLHSLQCQTQEDQLPCSTDNSQPVSYNWERQRKIPFNLLVIGLSLSNIFNNFVLIDKVGRGLRELGEVTEGKVYWHEFQVIILIVSRWPQRKIKECMCMCIPPAKQPKPGKPSTTW